MTRARTGLAVDAGASRRDRLARAVVAALVAALAAGGCFERGGKRRVRDDAGVAAARDAAPAGTWLDADPAGPPDRSATVTVALEAEPPSLDPFASADAMAARVLGDVYEGLVCTPPGGAPAPCLADRVAVDDGGRTWRFHLRPGVRFHDGTPVTVADVVASLRAPGHGAAATGPLAALLDGLTAVEPDGDAGVVVRFARARPGRDRDLALVPIAPAAHLAAGDLAAAPVGTGPLRVARWARGEVIELVRWDGYWGGPAAAARVRYRIADRSEAVRLLTRGEIDVALQIPLDQARELSGGHGRVVGFRYELPAFLAAIYHTRRPALAAPDRRRALTALLDRPGVARAILGGARVLTGPWPPGSPFADPSVSGVPFDRALAARLLGDARPTVTVMVPQGSTATARIADVWSADARGLATLRVEAVPYADFLARLAAGEFDVALTSMSSGPDVDLWSRFASDAPADQAWSGVADAELDRALVGYRDAEPAARAELARAIHRRLDQLQPVAFIAVDTRAGVARTGVGGLIGPPGRTGPPRGRDLWKTAR